MKQLGQAAIGTAVSTIYTVPANTTVILKEIVIASTVTSTVAVRIFVVPSAGTAGTGNTILYDWPVDGKSLYQNGYSTVLNAGMTIQVQAGATGLTITASGVEIA